MITVNSGMPQLHLHLGTYICKCKICDIVNVKDFANYKKKCPHLIVSKYQIIAKTKKHVEPDLFHQIQIS